MNYIKLNGEDEAQFYKMLVENISAMIPITVRGPDKKFIFTSAQFLNRLGLKPQNLVGKGSTELINENLYETSSSEKAFLLGENTKEFFHTFDGKAVYSESNIVRNNQGKLQYIVTCCTMPDEVLEEIDKLRTNLHHYKRETEYLRNFLMQDGKNLVFASKEMLRMLEKAVKVAPTNASVLITGESGVGKEVVAKTIHNNSNRKEKPFVPICIPQISPSLIESELFGYEKGAFTGASNSGRSGLLEIANGGTVFLDEVGDIPMDLQVKLLRILETREFTRVGGTKTIKLDVRFLAATNKDVKQMAHDGKFREDLFYRMSVIHLHINPLRERKDDIIPLTNYFISQLKKNYGVNHQLSEEVYQMFLQYPWPGNVRELRNVIEKLIILSDDVLITSDTVQTVLGDEDFNLHDDILPSFHSKQTASLAKSNLAEEYNNIERQRILDVLVQTNGNRKQAAKLLGISRSTLYRRLQEFKDL